MEITIYTANLTPDSLDPDNWIRPGWWETELRRYVDLAIASVQAIYPDAVIQTEPGNGLRVCDVDVDLDSPLLSYQIVADVEDVLSTVYQTWTETISDDHCYTQTDHPEPGWPSGASD